MKHPRLTALTLAAALASAGAAYAQQAAPNPAPGPMDHDQMMKGDGNMPMMGMMREMSTMMGNCNKMMQSMMERQNQGTPGQPQPAPQGNRG